MTLPSLDLSKAIYTIWTDFGLDWEFKKNWEESKRSEYITLHDEEASPKQPFPYCVYQLETPNTSVRMTETESAENKREIRDVMCQFNIHARQIDGVSKSAREIAGLLAAHAVSFFGGHPTEKPKQLTLDNGYVINAQLETEYGVRTGDEEYQWIVRYLFKLDVPVAVI